MEDLFKCMKNAKEIMILSKAVFKKFKGFEFNRKPMGGKSPQLRKCMMEMGKELAIEVKSVRQGISATSARRWAKFWDFLKMCVLAVVCFFGFKNYGWPYLKGYWPASLLNDYIMENYY